MVAFLFLLASVQLLAWLLPAWSDFKGVPYYLPLHVLLETASIIVSMMVFAVGWNSRSSNLSGNVVLLASVFFSVGMLDFLHTVSYVGMPDFISPNDSQKHLNFWLSARLFAALVLLVVAIRPWKPLHSKATRYLIFGSLLSATLAINWAVVYHQSWFPDTFIPGQGLTPFKKNVEYIVIAINVVTAIMFLARMRERQPFNAVLLFGTVCTLAMSEFFFTLYTTMIGSYNILGHIYKVIAYLLIYRAIVVEVIEEPYLQLKLAEEQLRHSQQLLDSIIENIPNMIFLKRASDLRFELFNRAGEELLGHERSKLLGKNDYDFFPREQADSFINKDRAVLAQQKVVDIPEEPIATAHGVRFLHTKKVPLNDAQGRPQYLLGISEDITERKWTEDALKKSEERLRLEVARMPIGYILLDKDFRVVSWNPAAENIFGFTFDEAKGRQPSELIVPPELQPQVDDIWRRLLAGDESAYSVNENQTKDGRTILCSWTNTPLKQPDGTILGVIAMVQDVTESKKAEEEIKMLNRELEQRVIKRTADLEAANKELEAFSYSVSHDLRAPLRAIDGFTHILQEDYANKLDDEAKRLLNVVRENANRMGQLIDDILQFSRTGRLEIALSRIDMEKIAREVFAELHASIAGSNLQLDIEHIPPARGDSALMRQVFVNLLSNAIKFSRGKETPKIQVGATVKDDEVIYYVKDNGAGFDMQYADKLFGVFQRLHSVNEFEGTGIGLSIVKRIITRHGGRVWAEGKVNEGATIYFALPNKGNGHE